MQQLAHHLHLDKSSVSGLIDRAERRGLVRRFATTEDGRAVRVSWTPQGQKIMAEVEKAVNLEIADLVKSLSPREQTQLSRLASRLASVDSRVIDE
jgi:DNA-binding MarR family transcriptional regulator